MADYKVRVTEYALNQMMETVQYIKVELDAPLQPNDGWTK